MKVSSKLALSPHLLWEYDIKSFDFDKSKKLVIERAIERGNLSDWQVIVNKYGKEIILQVSRKSKQLSKRDQQFTELFIDSSFLDAPAYE